ncbi:uncharacterized protein LOC143200740 [Rhynchophorus ferrugineus]|uniref:uncharacterized protein LOC143200740 n=1 Tax=Rhynchophorus ferrugineus TaxID=354439 RepID=UPI003FCDDF0D
MGMPSKGAARMRQNSNKETIIENQKCFRTRCRLPSLGGTLRSGILNFLFAFQSDDSTKSPAHFDIRLEQTAITQTPPSEWTTVINKKRLRSPEEEIARKQTRISDYWLQKPIETKNSFSNLSEEIEENIQPSPEKVVAKPPPINIHDLLKTITTNYTIKTVSYETIKIQLFEADHFKVLVKELDERNTQYHTFRPKSERTFKFVLKGLHHGTDFNTIKVALAEQGHEVVNVHNIRHRTTKKPSAYVLY